MAKIKKNYTVREYKKWELRKFLKLYDALTKTIQKRQQDRFLIDYRWNIETNQIKPALISQKLLTPYWELIGKKRATKKLIKMLKK